MFNLMRSYAWRLVRSRMFWALLAGAVVLSAVAAWAVRLPTTPLGAGLDTGRMDELAFESASALYHKLDPLQPVVVSVFAVVFFMQDETSRFSVTLVAPLGRRRMLAQAVVVLGFCILWCSLCIGAIQLGFLAFGFSMGAEPLDALAGNMVLSMGTCFAYAMLSVAVAQFLRSKAAGILAAVFLSCGMVGQVLSLAFTVLVGGVMGLPGLAHTVVLCLPSTLADALRQGASSAAAMLAPYTSMPFVLWAALVVGAWSLAALAALRIMEAKRDVA